MCNRDVSFVPKNEFFHLNVPKFHTVTLITQFENFGSKSKILVSSFNIENYQSEKYERNTSILYER